MPLKILNRSFLKKTSLLLFLSLIFFKLEDVQGESLTINDSDQDSFDNESIISPFSVPELETLPNSRFLASTPPAIGQILGKVDSSAFDMVMSPDGKTLYVSTIGFGDIEVIDISNLKAPVLIGSLTFKMKYSLTALALSPDGKTLYKTSSTALDIIDVTDPANPKILGYKWDVFLRHNYRPSIVVSADGNVVYTAGVGFSEFDVSDKTNPKLRYYNESEMTQVVMNKDKTKLFLADGTLRIYDCTNSNALKMISEIKPHDPTLAFYTVMLSVNESSLFALNSILTDDHFADIAQKKERPYGIERYSIENIDNPIIVEAVVTTCPLPLFIMNVSPNDTSLYTTNNDRFLILGLDPFKISTSPKILTITYAIAFSPDKKLMIISNGYEVTILRMYLNVEMNQTIPAEERQLQSIKNLYQGAGTDNTLFALSANGKTGFLLRIGLFGPQFLDILDISKPKDPVLISSIIMNAGFDEVLKFLVCGVAWKIELSKDERLLYISTINTVLFYDISDLKSPAFKGKIETKISAKHVFFSEEQKAVYLAGGEWKDLTDFRIQEIQIYDISDLQSLKQIGSIEIPDLYENSGFMVSKHKKLIIIFAGSAYIYDISDMKTLQEISSFPLKDWNMKCIFGWSLSSDHNLLYTGSFTKYFTFSIYNISNPRNVSLVSATIFPGIVESYTVSFDDKLLYVIKADSIFVYSLSNPARPSMIGSIPKSEERFASFLIMDIPYPASRMKISKNGEVFAMMTKNRDIHIMSLVPKFPIFFETDEFEIGKKKTIVLDALNHEHDKTYASMEQNYKIIKVSSCEIEQSIAQKTIEVNYHDLPDWMQFNKDKNIFSVEPKLISHMGTYKIFSVVSLALPMESLIGLESVKNLTDAQDLISTLIGLDYLDKERFLTANFDPKEELLLPSKYSNENKTISRILSSVYSSSVSRISVVPSLVIQVKSAVETKTGSIIISTPNPSSVKVSIRLDQTNTNAKAFFVRKTYSSVYTSISDKRASLIIEGTLADVNNALKHIVIDISDPQLSYHGELVVSDGMNPPIPKNIRNLETFFRINEVPRLNKSVQLQLDEVPISTGEYFMIELDSDTFWDIHEDDLEYYLAPINEGEELPTWLSLKGLTLMGKPPETWKTLQYNLMLMAKNEFKFIKVPFTLNVRISALYGLKMLGSLVGSILTAIGTWYTINKIYNVLAKKSYIHPKIFQVEVGKEITPQCIYPIGFIAMEIRESNFIFKKLEEYMKRTFKLKNNKEMINFFIGELDNLLDKSLICKTIEEAVTNLSAKEINNKLRLYLPGINSRKEIIEQLIINELTLKYLNLSSDKVTKEAFLKLKDNWPQIIEFNALQKFIVNREKLKNKLLEIKFPKVKKDKKSKNNEGEPLINTENNKVVNLELLEDALLAYGFHYQNFNLHFLDVRIEFRQKAIKPTKFSFFKKFFKLNLKSNDFIEKGLCYGVYFKMEDNTLTFYGTPHRNLAGHTLIFQITNKRGKILRELWIDGFSNESNDKFKVEVVKHEKDIL